MAIKKRTDQLPAILSGDVDNNDLMYLVHENAQAETGYDSKKIFVSDVGRKLNNGVEYATELPSFPPGDQNPLDALEYLNSKINDLYPVDSATGSLVNFTTSLALPLVALKTNITAQGGGGTPSSPVAVTGFSEIELTCADENMQTVDTFTLPLGQTVYGGYVDWKNGKGYVTWGSANLGDLHWTALSATSVFACDDDELLAPIHAGQYNTNEVICSIYTPSPIIVLASNLPNNQMSFNFNGNRLMIHDDRFTIASDFKTAMNGIIVAYELATPIEISLPTTMPSTIEGVQNWFADSGDIELEYKMGVQEYIDKKIAEVQTLIL